MPEKKTIFKAWGWDPKKMEVVPLFAEETEAERRKEEGKEWIELDCANAALNVCSGHIWLPKWRIDRAQRLGLSGPFCANCSRISYNLGGSGKTFPGEPQ